MTVIKAKTLSDKINLFIKVADEDGNGFLSFDEVKALTTICLAKFIHVEIDTEHARFMEDMSEYFAKLIFDTCMVATEDEIPFEQIRKLILEVRIWFLIKNSDTRIRIYCVCSAARIYKGSFNIYCMLLFVYKLFHNERATLELGGWV